MIEALDIQVRGIVQGVGFRPFVYRMAKKYLVNGWVLNATDGVFIHAEGEGRLLDEFVLELSDNAPAAAQVDEVEMKEVPLEPCEGFEIRFSDAAAVEKTTLVSPDLALCDDCLRELENPNDRRYHYPFINCTNCGPRFTIIDALPYDRANTSMKGFEMCPRCEREYSDPADRRFHAQPDACFECGPRVSWRLAGSEEVRWGATLEESDAVFAEAARLLREGCILAVKGLGGYHLVCDANNAAAVAELRRRKRREGKAFAVMMADAPGVRAVCEANPAEERVLSSAQRPIVLLRKKPGVSFAPGLADGLSELGVMLPYTPVQVLLLSAFAGACRVGPKSESGAEALAPELSPAETRGFGGDARELGTSVREPWRANPPMLVMTSGNVHDEPICMNDGEACDRLAGIADAFLGNDRPILTRFDDSVVRVVRTEADPAALDAAGASAAADDAAVPNGVSNLCRGASVAVVGAGASPAPAGDSAAPFSASGAAALGDDLEPGTAIQFIRRARGFAPAPVKLPFVEKALQAADRERPVVFAAGPEQKNTFAFLRGAEAFVSQHIGDMENAETYDAWLQAKARFEGLFDMRVGLFACDMHPEYLSSKWAREQVRGISRVSSDAPPDAAVDVSAGVPPDASSASAQDAVRGIAPASSLVEVQHHHAHVAAVMAEHGLGDAVCGIAFDGTGYGVDGAIWGGEVLLANLTAFERFANFAYVPMPGGAAAIKNPLRMAYGVLWAFDLLEHPAAQAALAPLGEQATLCEQMIEKGLNTPMTSSVGRLFDAASALLGICTQPKYEGEGAVLLEACMSAGPAADAWDGFGAVWGSSDAAATHAAEPPAAEPRGAAEPSASAMPAAASCSPSTPAAEASAHERYAIAVTKNTATEASTAQDTSVLLFDAAPVFAALLDDMAAGMPAPVIARRFHDAFVGAVVSAAEFVRALYGIETVVLAGGVFMNRYLLEHALAELSAAGFTAAISRDLPPNDGSISLGQAVIAWARNEEGL